MKTSTLLRKITPTLCATLATGSLFDAQVHAAGEEQGGTESAGTLKHIDPVIVEKATGALTGSIGNITASQDSTFDEGSKDKLVDRYLVGAALEGASAPVPVLGKDDTITITNNVVGSGVIGMDISASTVGQVDGTIDVTGTKQATGLRVSGTDFGTSGVSSTLGNLSADIHVESTDDVGTAYGIDLSYGIIGSITGSNITVESKGAATGINVAGGTTLGAPNTRIGYMNDVTMSVVTTGEQAAASALLLGDGASLAFDPKTTNDGYVVKNANVTVTGQSGQLSFATAHLTKDTIFNKGGIGKISGSFTMNSNNKNTTSYVNMSVGYILGSELDSTVASLGFKNTNTTDGYQGSSLGFDIDWNNTSMYINRDIGFAVGSVIVGTDQINGMNLQYTTLGKSNIIHTTTGAGSAVGVWLNGIDLTHGQLLGSVKATAGTGIAVGLGSGGSDLSGTSYVTQVPKNTILNIVAGKIEARVEQELVAAANIKDPGTMVIGVQIGNAYGNYDTGYSHYKTEFSDNGGFYGEVNAQLDDVINEDGTLGVRNAVIGILNYGAVDEKLIGTEYPELYKYLTGEDKVIFNATAQDGDKAGTSVSALIYDQTAEGKKLVAFGNAVQSMVGDTVLTTNSTHAGNTTRLIGNLTTGGDVLNTSTPEKMSGQRKLVFEKGHFTVTSEQWNAADGVTFGGEGSFTKVIMTDILTVEDGARIAAGVGSTLEINSSTLNFHAQNDAATSTLVLGKGMTLDLNRIATSDEEMIINIFLEGDKSLYENSTPLYFIDARLTDNFDADNTNITYNLYLNEDLQPKTSNFKIIHDETGVYLYVPEPSTATLSLLALGALMARRRRRV